MEEGTNAIRIVQSEIEAQIEKFKTAPDTIYVKTSYVCDNVRDHILNCQDEPHLSKTQNNHRRIFIASELFNSFCGIFAHVVDYEYAQIIKDIIQWEKYKSLSRRINSKMQLELRREKYFAGEAQSKLVKALEDTGTAEATATDREEQDSEMEVVPHQQRDSEMEVVPHQQRDSEMEVVPHQERDSEMDIVPHQQRESLPTGPEQMEVTETGEAVSEVNETLAPPPLEGSFRTELPSNITEIREGITDTTHFELPISPTLRQEPSLPNIDAETSIRASTVQQRADEDEIDRILQILEDGVLPTEAPVIQQPENLEETARKSPELVAGETVPENLPVLDGTDTEGLQAAAPESSEGWSLPSLEEVESTRRRHRYLIIDRTTVIRDYAARALELNRSIKIQRVQAFDGPPTVVEAISANHLMTTPGCKSSLFRDRRGSKLSTLYNRHLGVEKKPVEERRERRPVEQRDVDISKVRANTEIMEDVGMRAGMHSRPERSDVLVDVPEKIQPVDLDLTAAGAPPKESLVGVPISRIINSTIEPPGEDQMERINAAPEPTPSVQQLQGKSIDRRTSPPWFISTRENPPSDKYRKFNYVDERLQMYWSMLESQGMEKRFTIREFLYFEGNESVEDFLTVLRVVDKMSIQRKLLLEYKSGDVVVRPFETPYITDIQLLLKEKEPVL